MPTIRPLFFPSTLSRPRLGGLVQEGQVTVEWMETLVLRSDLQAYDSSMRVDTLVLQYLKQRQHALMA